MKCTAY